MYETCQFGQYVAEAVVETLVETKYRAARIYGRKCLDIGTFVKGVHRGLREAYEGFYRSAQIAPAGSLAAPGRAKDKGTAIGYAYGGIVVIEKFRSRESLYPEPGMGAFAGAAAPHKEIALAVADNAGGVKGQSFVQQYVLREKTAQRRGYENACGTVGQIDSEASVAVIIR